MEPEIRYVRSADGTSIATWTWGSGPFLLAVPGFGFGTVQIAIEFPGFRAELEVVARSRTVVSYDFRGFGLSDHDCEDFSLPALVADLDAVAQSIGAGPVDLIGRGAGGPAAIVWAAESGRVRRLVLNHTIARGRDLQLNPKRRLLSPLIEVDFELYTQTMALVDFGWTDVARRAAELIATINPRMFGRSWAARREWDASGSLPAIGCPTLVIHHRDARDGFVTLDSARALAATIAGARLVVHPGQPLTSADDGAALGRVIAEFLDVERGGSARAESVGTATVLFADIVDSTALTESMGDAAFRAKARELDDAMRAAIRACSGTPVDGKLVGDGVLAVFSSASQAIDAALRCSAAGDGVGLKLHLGIHAGDVIREANNVYGGAVNIAARIAAASAPGEILVSDTVRNLARTSASAIFEDRGEHALKGIGEPIRIFSVREARRQ
jgi:class 3 adenylate cyclase